MSTCYIYKVTHINSKYFINSRSCSVGARRGIEHTVENSWRESEDCGFRICLTDCLVSNLIVWFLE